MAFSQTSMTRAQVAITKQKQAAGDTKTKYSIKVEKSIKADYKKEYGVEITFDELYSLNDNELSSHRIVPILKAHHNELELCNILLQNYRSICDFSSKMSKEARPPGSFCLEDLPIPLIKIGSFTELYNRIK